jgi:hypothetical protein
MEPATPEMIDCVGDCNGLLRISIENESGDPWKVAERAYHFSLMNDDVLAARHLPAWLSRKKVTDPRFNEVYETASISNPDLMKETWYVEREKTGKIASVISCSRDTPQVQCKGSFTLQDSHKIKVHNVIFHGTRLDDWNRIRDSIDRLIQRFIVR